MAEPWRTRNKTSRVGQAWTKTVLQVNDPISQDYKKQHKPLVSFSGRWSQIPQTVTNSSNRCPQSFCKLKNDFCDFFPIFKCKATTCLQLMCLRFVFSSSYGTLATKWCEAVPITPAVSLWMDQGSTSILLWCFVRCLKFCKAALIPFGSMQNPLSWLYCKSWNMPHLSFFFSITFKTFHTASEIDKSMEIIIILVKSGIMVFWIQFHWWSIKF